MIQYEIVLIYDKEYGEVIIFESNKYMNDSNDIVTHAIHIGLIEKKYRNRVRWARAISEYEFEYVKCGWRYDE